MNKATVYVANSYPDHMHMNTFHRSIFCIIISIVSSCLAIKICADTPAVLMLGGGSRVIMVDATKVNGQGGYEDGIIWQWDAKSAAETMGIEEAKCDHIDDCRLINDNTQVLVSSSYNWVALVDIASDELMFWTTKCTNAHSAYALPNGKIAVSCSSGGDQIQIYNADTPNKVIAYTTLQSAHGSVWVESRQRLYGIGGNQLVEYSIDGIENKWCDINKVKSVTAPASGLHDINVVDDNTLILGGKKCYLYDIETEQFTALKRFKSCTALKSLNYNASNGEMWFTDATTPEGDYSWSTHTVHHILDTNDAADHCTFKVPDLNLYKVRVVDWGKCSGNGASINSVTEDAKKTGIMALGNSKFKVSVQQNCQVYVFNMCGNILQHHKSLPAYKTIDLSNYPKAVYFIKVGEKVFKVIAGN